MRIHLDNCLSKAESMKNNSLVSIVLLAILLMACQQSFLNSCDENSISFKETNAFFTSSKSGLSVDFTNNSINAEDYLWEFGDGTTSKEVNPKKTYSSAKSYKIILTANRCGGQKKKVFSQTIDMACEVAPPVISSTSATVCNGTAVTFTASGCNGGEVNWVNNMKGTSVSFNPISDMKITATCVQGNCISNKSNEKSITVTPLLKVVSSSAVVTNLVFTKSYNVTLKGQLVNSKNDMQVSDYGFIYVKGADDPLNVKDASILSLSKKVFSGNLYFEGSISSFSSNIFVFRAYVVNCDGKKEYGQLIKNTK